MGKSMEFKEGCRYYYILDNDKIKPYNCKVGSMYFENEEDARLEQIKRKI